MDTGKSIQPMIEQYFEYATAAREVGLTPVMSFKEFKIWCNSALVDLDQIIKQTF